MVKCTQTIFRVLPTNCLSVFDEFIGLVHKGLRFCQQNQLLYIFHERRAGFERQALLLFILFIYTLFTKADNHHLKPYE